MPTDEIAIPITVTIIIMGLYIVGGAALFSEWEEWDMVTSIYFTWVTLQVSIIKIVLLLLFQITLTTIGFGDYSPGDSFHGEMTFVQVLKMMTTTFYCLLGLAIISMGISLSAEQVIISF